MRPSISHAGIQQLHRRCHHRGRLAGNCSVARFPGPTCAGVEPDYAAQIRQPQHRNDFQEKSRIGRLRGARDDHGQQQRGKNSRQRSASPADQSAHRGMAQAKFRHKYDQCNQKSHGGCPGAVQRKGSEYVARRSYRQRQCRAHNPEFPRGDRPVLAGRSRNRSCRSRRTCRAGLRLRQCRLKRRYSRRHFRASSVVWGFFVHAGCEREIIRANFRSRSLYTLSSSAGQDELNMRAIKK